MGQLIAYENQLKKERDLNVGASPEESSNKKQCLAEVGLPTPPTPQTPSSAQVRPRSFKPFAFKSASSHSLSTAAQSPTTALSKLSFGGPPLQPSPLSEEPDSDSSDTFSISGFPMTSLDKVVPIPCLTVGSATKRSLSMSTFELRSIGTSDDKKAPGGDTLTEDSVKLRSPEMRAKRPNVQRPNSIAFSSCFSTDTSQQQSQEVSNTSVLTSQASVPPPPPPTVLPVPSLLSTSTLEQQSRKSRSLEDILGPDNPLCGHGLRKRLPDNQLYVGGGTLAGGGALGGALGGGAEGSRLCDGAGQTSSSTHHQSNSSISSSGSIHGSLELIQVS